MDEVLSTQNYNPNDTFQNTTSLPAVDSTHAWTNSNSDTTATAVAITTDVTNETTNQKNPKSEGYNSVNETLPSKEETEKWILSKFESYSLPFSLNNSISYSNIVITTSINQIYFDEYYLIIIETFESTNETRPESERKIVTKIPVADINEISSYKNSSLFFTTNKKTILIKHGLKNQTVSETASFGFKSDTETDLIDRIKKAFLNLKRFYKMPKNNETF